MTYPRRYARHLFRGDVAEWLRSGLQSRVHRFDSGRRLDVEGHTLQAAGARAVAVDSVANQPLRAGSGRRARGALIAVSVALFCIQVDFFALNLALPDIGRTFHAGPSELQWSISAYMLSLGSLFIIAGRIGDIFGGAACYSAASRYSESPRQRARWRQTSSSSSHSVSFKAPEPR